ncbi:Ribonuclease T2-like [Cytospora mali]|uniref:Ribonuclease T2-like n=1 Tax=Cytospora mali TaxID=578113 RepID=A0A194UUM6_CYTMA|nr:Ribonuclease T2-like [Valsa mali var. pyri (nom. inval.)]
MAISALALLAPLIALPLVNADTGASIFKKRDTCSTSVESCSTAASSASSCCVNKPGGLLLQTQFWDTDPVTGPANSWTIHGLWPDNCDGTYSESCDSSRDYTDITELIEKYGSTSLLDYMDTYWLSDDESNEKFWEHEWSTHGTCVSTLDPDCYTDYETGEEAVDFFQVVVDLFKTLDTYSVLSDAGIVPSNSKTYTSDEIISAISDSFGKDPVILCDSDTLYQIYYGFYVTGPLTDADFVPTTITGSSSSCPDSGIKYPVKSGATSVSTVATATSTSAKKTTTATKTTTVKTTSTSSTATATGSSVSGSGYWYTYYDGSQDGCLISYGTWYIGGTCATYHATSSGSGFTMTTSKGDCGVVDGAISCGDGVSSSTFSVIDGLLAYNGQTTFYSSEVPSGSEQAEIYTSDKSVSVTFEWSS